jgi:hypothetical protein
MISGKPADFGLRVLFYVKREKAQPDKFTLLVDFHKEITISATASVCFLLKFGKGNELMPFFIRKGNHPVDSVLNLFACLVTGSNL